jgi:hypothetical protein
LSSHTDLWPSIFDHLQLTPALDANRYSDGRSLLDSASSTRVTAVTGRFFPYAERPSVLVDGFSKYWFRVATLGARNRLCIVVTKVTDPNDQPLPIDSAQIDGRMLRAFESYQSSFWRFLEPVAGASAPRAGLSVC